MRLLANHTDTLQHERPFLRICICSRKELNLLSPQTYRKYAEIILKDADGVKLTNTHISCVFFLCENIVNACSSRLNKWHYANTTATKHCWNRG